MKAEKRRTADAYGPFCRLLTYVPAHRKVALLTTCFGCLGFLLSFVYPWIIGHVIDLGAEPGRAVPSSDRARELLLLTYLAAVTGVLHAVALYGRGHFNVQLSAAIVADIRRDLFAHLQQLGARFYSAERSGAILSRLINDVHEATSLIYAGILVAAMDVAQFVLAFALLSSISYKLALSCGLVFPLYGVVFRCMNPQVRAASEHVNAQLSELSADVCEQLAGQALVKTYCAEARERKRFDASIERLHRLILQQSRAGHLVGACGEVLVHIGTTVVIGYGGWLMLSGELSPGRLTRFLGYVVILYGPVRRFAELNITYESSLSAMRRVARVFEIRPAIRNLPGARKSPPTDGRVCFEDVHFSYHHSADGTVEQLEPREEPRAADVRVLDGVDLTAEAGERIAIVGSSGTGKTTLVSLLPRLYDVTHGRITIDDRDVRAYTLEALRSCMAIVQQDSFVFSGTVRDNIRYGRPEATEREILAAAEAAHAHDFIVNFPQGYDAQLGERGINLSGGQRQRIAIARALLRNPRILILDEATSSLDTESESIVQAALLRLMRGRTCFVVAHRLSTIRDADRIVVLERGQIVESGTHAALAQTAGAYARLLRSQATLHAPALAR
jgi:ABC-type multidrug transport system fused ATPase/permease subunit